MNELAMNNVENLDNAFEGSQETVFSTFSMDSPQDKMILYKAINTPDHRIKDMINMQISIKDVYIEKISVTKKDENGNEMFDEEGYPLTNYAPRIVIVDDKGKSYTAVSQGVFNAVKRIFEILGNPHDWEKPIKFTVKQINKGNNRNILTFEPVF